MTDHRFHLLTVRETPNTRLLHVMRGPVATRENQADHGARDMLACRSITEWTYKPSVELTGFTGPGHERRS